MRHGLFHLPETTRGSPPQRVNFGDMMRTSLDPALVWLAPTNTMKPDNDKPGNGTKEQKEGMAWPPAQTC